MNRAIIAGYVGTDPETRDTSAGPVAKLSIATKRSGKDDRPDWHRITAFGKTAELISNYIRKGSYLTVEGRIQYSQYTDKTSGETKYTTQILADRIYFGPKTSSSPATDGDESYPESWDQTQGG